MKLTAPRARRVEPEAGLRNAYRETSFRGGLIHKEGGREPGKKAGRRLLRGDGGTDYFALHTIPRRIPSMSQRGMDMITPQKRPVIRFTDF